MATRARLATALLVVAFAAVPAGAQRPAVPYVPTPHQVVRAMLDVARVDSTDIVYDLGSGDGRIVIAAAQRHGARGLGVDIDAELVAVAMRNAETARVQDRVEFRLQDLFELDLSPASVITLYLLSDVNLRLRPRILEQLRPGTRVVSHAFDMRDWQPDSVLWVPYNSSRARVFYWVVPAQVGGSWTIQVEGEAPLELVLAQRFQLLDVSGPVQPTGEQRRLGDGRLRGERIVIALPATADGRARSRRLTGRVDGDEMRGVVEETGRRWSARRTTR